MTNLCGKRNESVGLSVEALASSESYAYEEVRACNGRMLTK